MIRPVHLLLCLCWLPLPSAHGNALDDYVQKPDPSYAWSLYHETGDMLARHYILKLVSQQWLDTGKVDAPEWHHVVRFSQPRRLCGKTALKSRTAILVINGSKHRKDKSKDKDKRIPPGASLLAYAFCRPVIELRQIPNQPLLFTDETTPRKEDALLAYSFDRFLLGAPGEWPAHMAMVKATVRGMDAMQAFSRTREDIPDIDDFILFGTSKRGWTAWLTGAVDARVRAIVPISIDMPNLPAQFPHHFAAYGDYARALADYKAINFGCRMRSGRGHQLLDIIDPLSYRQRLLIPKLVINSAGDEFFVSDSAQFYFDQMPGENRLRYTVNTDHRQHGNGHDLEVFEQARNWVNNVLAGTTPPDVQWNRGPGNRLTVRPSAQPYTVKLWQADNPEARDFRRETLGPVWQETRLKPDHNGTYHHVLQPPEKGWRAALVEVTFGGALTGRQQIYTTPVFVLPDTMPFSSINPCQAHETTRAPAEKK